MELRVGIEPTSDAYKATALPLIYRSVFVAVVNSNLEN